MANIRLPKTAGRFILTLKNNSKKGMWNDMPFAETVLRNEAVLRRKHNGSGRI